METGEKAESLQNIAIKIIDEQRKLLDTETGPQERTVFILGSKNVGKSRIINKFFDRDETTRPTLALEYSFGRRSGQPQSIQKEVLNVWELGSLENSRQLIEVPMKNHGLDNFSAMIVLDLSQPNQLWADVKAAFEGLKEAYSYSQSSNKQVVRTNSKEHPDDGTLDICPFPLVVVGGKYDLFQNFDPEVKKQVCRCLRSVAHLSGAALIFYSYKIANLSKAVRDTFSHLGFGSPSHPLRRTIFDYNEQISIWFGQDSWENIGTPPATFQAIGVYYCSKIPQAIKGSESLPDDPAKDVGFKESLIDEMRAQKDEELVMLVKETNIRTQFESVAS